MKTEVAGFAETLVTTYVTTWCHAWKITILSLLNPSNKLWIWCTDEYDLLKVFT